MTNKDTLRFLRFSWLFLLKGVYYKRRFETCHHTNETILSFFTDLETLNPQLIKYGETQVLYQGILFFRSSSYKDKTYWRCSNTRTHDCKARFQTTGSQIIKPYLVHNHSNFSQNYAKFDDAGPSMKSSNSCDQMNLYK